MSQPYQPGLFDAPAPSPVPATAKQMAFAQSIAQRTGAPLPKDADRRALSAWIDRHKSKQSPHMDSRLAALPSAKQVAFAERIARLKRREVPAECFKDRTLMSRWIDGNKPR